MKNIKTKAFAPFHSCGSNAPSPVPGKDINYSGDKDYSLGRGNDNSVASKHSEMSDPFSAKESLQNGLNLREKL